MSSSAPTWAVFRKSQEVGDDEAPELRFVTDALDEGLDPVAAYLDWSNDLNDED